MYTGLCLITSTCYKDTVNFQHFINDSKKAKNFLMNISFGKFVQYFFTYYTYYPFTNSDILNIATYNSYSYSDSLYYRVS